MRKSFKKMIAILLAVGLIVPTSMIISVLGAEEPELEVVFHESFESLSSDAVQSGDANLSYTEDKDFDGNENGNALYISNRVNDWDAADFMYEDIGVQAGQAYTISIVGYVDEDAEVPAGAQAVVNTLPDYNWLVNVDITAGEAFTMTWEDTLPAGSDRLRIQSNADGASVPFYIGEIVIVAHEAASVDEEVDEDEDPRDPALPFTTITFEDQQFGGFEGRAGTETLTITDEANRTEDGSYSLKVEGRENNWHGPSLRVEQYVDRGYEYQVSMWVKLISPDITDLQLSTQVGDGGSASYNNIQSATIGTDDGWVQLQGSYRYNSVGDEYLTLYVESTNSATASFYIDDISFVKGTAPTDIERDLLALKDVYADDFLIGNAVSAADLEGVRLELLQLHHNAVTAENAMKPGELQPTKGDFTFEGADTIVDKALEEDIEVFGHVLVWHQQSPAWMNTSTDDEGNTIHLSREEALENMRTHIRTVMEHFGDRLIGWDVVNEAMSDNPSNPSDWEAALRQSDWYHAIGSDYVEQAFLAAREVLDENPDWDVKLYYNDYNDDNQNKSTAIYHMIKQLNERYAEDNPGKLLIDGMGMQGHYNINTNPENVRLSLERFISLDIEVSVTELDITAGSDGVLSEQEAEAQGYLYAQLFSLYQEHAEHIARVTFWGLNDATSWRAQSSPLLFDGNLQAKPAYYAVIDPASFIETYAPDVTEAKQSIAVYGTPEIDGVIDEVWDEAPLLSIDVYQTAWHGATGTARALWDEQNLYVLIQVNDDELDKQNSNAWEQDSIEVFVDENNAKTSFYQEDDGQYRVNFDNEISFNPASIAEGFESATQLTASGYIVEVKIPLTTITPAEGMDIGFDLQINDATGGSRTSVAAWNDATGNGYQDTSVFGVITLSSDANTTIERAEFIAQLMQALELQADIEQVDMFNDVELSARYYDELAMAKELSIALGFADGSFRPDHAISRQDAIVLVARTLEAAGQSLLAGSLDGYPDADAVSDYAKASVASLIEMGMVVDQNGIIAPSDSLTRAEAAEILHQLRKN